jgi:hypothetical protein
MGIFSILLRETRIAAAYGWPATLSDDDGLTRLLALNCARAAAGQSGLAAGRCADAPWPDPARRSINRRTPRATSTGSSRRAVSRNPSEARASIWVAKSSAADECGSQAIPYPCLAMVCMIPQHKGWRRKRPFGARPRVPQQAGRASEGTEWRTAGGN